MALPTPRALIFDVFGTLVDWRGSIAREVREAVGGLGRPVDGEAFADAWRAQYQPAMEAVRAGGRPFCKLDQLHRENLDVVLKQFGLDEHVDAPARAALTHAWHRLDAWYDVGPGLARLRSRFVLAPCSNGNVSLMVDLARRNGWHWDAILGAEFARDYKPRPGVYRAAAEALDLRPAEVVMVAAHSDDLAAAAEAGLQTAFVARPHEHGPGRGERSPTVPVRLAVDRLVDLMQL